ncbi:MAG: hypothetical protein JO197_22150 [Acidobacteria bacterium]|nr:hypothetical protein [Acidobacteriota bacterium]MBV9474840.1 hypothetical protein [Acidobacteriota bacterium]
MILPVLALAITATFQPAAPTVGDPIAIHFDGPVTLDASPAYEIVSQRGADVVVRTFDPKPFALSGVVRGVHFRNLVVPMHSVLKPNDDRKPAPLAPPRATAYPRLPFVAIAIAALCALGVWLLVWRRAKQTMAATVPALPPDERFRRAIDALRAHPFEPLRWSRLADETRVFLAATRAGLGRELTTSELLPRLGDERDAVAMILRQGDLEKFSTSGAEERDFDAVAADALALIPPPEPPPIAATERAA